MTVTDTALIVLGVTIALVLSAGMVVLMISMLVFLASSGRPSDPTMLTYRPPAYARFFSLFSFSLPVTMVASAPLTMAAGRPGMFAVAVVFALVVVGFAAWGIARLHAHYTTSWTAAPGMILAHRGGLNGFDGAITHIQHVGLRMGPKQRAYLEVVGTPQLTRYVFGRATPLEAHPRTWHIQLYTLSPHYARELHARWLHHIFGPRTW